MISAKFKRLYYPAAKRIFVGLVALVILFVVFKLFLFVINFVNIIGLTPGTVMSLAGDGGAALK